MMRCSPEAFAKCPTSHLCGSLAESTFADDSECAAFNKKIEGSHNPCIARNDLIKLLNGYLPCEGPDSPDGCRRRYQGNCAEWIQLSCCVTSHLADYLLSHFIIIAKEETHGRSDC